MRSSHEPYGRSAPGRAEKDAKENDMTTKKTKAWVWALALGAMALGMLGTEGRAAATNPGVLTIDVDVVANLSVKINDEGSSTRALAAVTPGGSPVSNSASTSTVLSDATAINEFWKLSSANAVKADASLGWTLITSTSAETGGAPSTDEYALQALFISSMAAAGECPNGTDVAWTRENATPLTTTPVTYLSGATGKFAYQTDAALGGNGDPDFTAGGNDGRMQPNSFRGFCFRVVPPSDVTFTDDVKAYAIVTASLTQ